MTASEPLLSLSLSLLPFLSFPSPPFASSFSFCPFTSVSRSQRGTLVQHTVGLARFEVWPLVMAELRSSELQAVQKAPPDERCTWRPPQEPSRTVSKSASSLHYQISLIIIFLFLLVSSSVEVGVISVGVCDHRVSLSCSVEPLSQSGGTQTSTGPWVSRHVME